MFAKQPAITPILWGNVKLIGGERVTLLSPTVRKISYNHNPFNQTQCWAALYLQTLKRYKPLNALKAIVLSHDANRIIALHMAQCYSSVWPNHPFTFCIPFQTYCDDTLPSNVELIPTPREIRPTVLKLLADLDDETWIYWCIDDKYPIALLTDRIARLHNAIERENPPDIDGILFCRVRRMLKDRYLTGERREFEQETLLGRCDYSQIWIHQFIRVKVIRHLFQSFPENIGIAREMDPLKEQIPKPADHRIFVTAQNLAVFGESMAHGVILRNCYDSLLMKGFEIPKGRHIDLEKTVIMGQLDCSLCVTSDD